MAETLQALGSENAWITHGADEMDEVTTTGDTHIVTLQDGAIDKMTINPETYKLPLAKLADLKGGDAEVNAQAIRDLLSGTKSPYRDIVVLNAACALTMCGKADDIADGIIQAVVSIDSGAAQNKLDQLIEVTNNG